MMTQKGDPYIKLFSWSTLCGLRLLIWILT